MKHDPCVCFPDLPPSEVHHVITLVHGTWAKDAPWTRAQSKLCQRLQTVLGPGTVFCRLPWSGRNSHSARRRAARELRELLNEQARRFTDARLYIIGHSHGGSAALYAMQDVDDDANPLVGEKLRERIDGIACLSTPFLSARARYLGRDLVGQLSAGVVALGLVVLSLVRQTGWMSALSGWAHVAVSVLLLLFTWSPLILLAQGYRTLRPRLLRELAWPPLPRDKLLIMRSPADEASAGMAFAQILCQVSVLIYRRIWCGIDRFEEAVQNWSKRRWKPVSLFFAAFACIFVILFAGTALQYRGIFISKNAILAAVILSITVMLMASFLCFKWIEGVVVPLRIIAGLLLWPLILLLILLMLVPFGWEMAVAAVLLDVTAEGTPPGRWEVRQLEPPPPTTKGKDTLTLMHSVIYENPEAIQAICEWISPPVPPEPLQGTWSTTTV